LAAGIFKEVSIDAAALVVGVGLRSKVVGFIAGLTDFEVFALVAAGNLKLTGGARLFVFFGNVAGNADTL
jgi:hypothetical protein